MLRALYRFANSSHTMTESMVAGTVAGEMSFLSRTPRNTSVVAERDSTLWRMDVSAHEELGRKEGWQFARRFEEVVLKIANAETEVLMACLHLHRRLLASVAGTDVYGTFARRVTSCRVCEDGSGIPIATLLLSVSLDGWINHAAIILEHLRPLGFVAPASDEVPSRGGDRATRPLRCRGHTADRARAAAGDSGARGRLLFCSPSLSSGTNRTQVVGLERRKLCENTPVHC